MPLHPEEATSELGAAFAPRPDGVGITHIDTTKPDVIVFNGSVKFRGVALVQFEQTGVGGSLSRGAGEILFDDLKLDGAKWECN